MRPVQEFPCAVTWKIFPTLGSTHGGVKTLQIIFLLFILKKHPINPLLGNYSPTCTFQEMLSCKKGAGE